MTTLEKILARLDEIKERCERAPEGPWDIYFATGEGVSIIRYKEIQEGKYRSYEQWIYPGSIREKDKPTTEFICNSRTDLPQLEKALRDVVSQAYQYDLNKIANALGIETEEEKIDG